MTPKYKTSAIHEAKSDAQIQNCFEVMQELRPYLDKDNFVGQIKRMNSYGYRLIFIGNNQGKVVAAAGFRFTELLHWGKAVYIDDLSTMKSERGKGFASRLLDYIHQLAVDNKCEQIHLDSGCNTDRFDAHRLYLNKGYNITSHHFTYMVQ